MRDGLKFKAWQPGGAGTDFLTDQHLDLPMEFASIGKAGSRLGTALAMAVDHEINMVSLVRNLEEFFARESCGWCTPCRDGLPWSVKILRALEQKQGQPGDIETLLQLCRQLGRVKPSVRMRRVRLSHCRVRLNISVKSLKPAWHRRCLAIPRHWRDPAKPAESALVIRRRTRNRPGAAAPTMSCVGARI